MRENCQPMNCSTSVTTSHHITSHLTLPHWGQNIMALPHNMSMRCFIISHVPLVAWEECVLRVLVAANTHVAVCHREHLEGPPCMHPLML